MDHTVDRDGTSILESRGDSRKTRIEGPDEMPYLAPLDVMLDHAATEHARDRRRHDDARGSRRGRSDRTSRATGRRCAHSAASRGATASSAAERRGGDIGRSRMRTPVARAIALPMAAIGGTIGTSPTPRTP